MEKQSVISVRCPHCDYIVELAVNTIVDKIDEDFPDHFIWVDKDNTINVKDKKTGKVYVHTKGKWWMRNPETGVGLISLDQETDQ